MFLKYASTCSFRDCPSDDAGMSLTKTANCSGLASGDINAAALRSDTCLYAFHRKT
ncbi:hypothetical protein HanRHA438_Chr15g0707341 [Helianthus annuus]|nr:hypothetical protein HanRHA438_Chr15g0707341 [Helianthus annuus]